MSMPTIGNPDISSTLRQLNLNHLLYFWCVARAGSFSAAARALRVSQPSISEQVASLEAHLGQPLLLRHGRGVSLTPIGEMAARYAGQMVGVCSEFMRDLPLASGSPSPTISIGAADAIPKLVLRELLGPMLAAEPSCRIVCREWRTDVLLSELSLHRLDLVVCDAEIVARGPGRLLSYVAAQSGITLCGSPGLARQVSRRFPASLNGAPMLLPALGAALRASLDRWFDSNGVRPDIRLEAEDRAMLNNFAEAGLGVVPVATVHVQDVCRQFGLRKIAQLKGVSENYYVVFVERNSPNPLIAAFRERLSERYRPARGATRLPPPSRVRA